MKRGGCGVVLLWKNAMFALPRLQQWEGTHLLCRTFSTVVVRSKAKLPTQRLGLDSVTLVQLSLQSISNGTCFLEFFRTAGPVFRFLSRTCSLLGQGSCGGVSEHPLKLLCWGGSDICHMGGPYAWVVRWNARSIPLLCHMNGEQWSGSWFSRLVGAVE